MRFLQSLRKTKLCLVTSLVFMIVSDQASATSQFLECNLFSNDQMTKLRVSDGIFGKKIERRLKGRWTEFCKDVYLDYSDEDSIRITQVKGAFGDEAFICEEAFIINVGKGAVQTELFIL